MKQEYIIILTRIFEKCIPPLHTPPSNSADEAAYGIYNGPQGETVTGRYHGLLEVIDYARAVPGLSMMISHLTPIYLVPQPHPIYVDDAIRRATLDEIINRPRAEGLNISFNALTVPYSLSYVINIADTFMLPRMILPEWLSGLSRAEFIGKLEDPVFRSELTKFVLSGRFKFDMVCPATDPYWCREFVIHHCQSKAFEGKTPFELAIDRCSGNRENTIYSVALKVLYEIIQEDSDATWHFIDDKRIDIGQLVHPMSMVATDVPALSGEMPEGNSQASCKVYTGAYNAVPYYLEKLVKKDSLLSLPEAVRKLSTLPAEAFSIKDRG